MVSNLYTRVLLLPNKMDKADRERSKAYPFLLGYYSQPACTSGEHFIRVNPGDVSTGYAFNEASFEILHDAFVPGRLCKVHKRAYWYISKQQGTLLSLNESIVRLIREDTDSWECRINDDSRVWIKIGDMEIVE